MPDSIQPKGLKPSSLRSSRKVAGTATSTEEWETKEVRVYLATFENLDNVREFVKEAADQCGLTGFAIYAAQLAVDEAFSNIIEHAYGGECQQEIECTCLTSKKGLTIQLKDCGRPFDPTSVPEPDIKADLEDRGIGGLGLYFIRQLMDEVDFRFSIDLETGKQCNVLWMVKNKEN
jgi:serine/threonine-protein kinase RsbW